MTFVHHKFRTIMGRLQRMAKPAREQVRRCHWISTPNGDHGDEWCPDCGRAVVRHLRRRDRRNRGSYILDGGWRTEHDGPVFCAGCGSRLDGSLTDYGAEEELEHFTNHPPRPGNPHDALELEEMLNTLEYTSPDRAGMAKEAIVIAKKFLTESRRSVKGTADHE